MTLARPAKSISSHLGHLKTYLQDASSHSYAWKNQDTWTDQIRAQVCGHSQDHALSHSSSYVKDMSEITYDNFTVYIPVSHWHVSNHGPGQHAAEGSCPHYVPKSLATQHVSIINWLLFYATEYVGEGLFTHED